MSAGQGNHVGGLHDISLLLGELKGQVGTLVSTTRDLAQSIEDLSINSAQTTMVVHDCKNRIDFVEQTLTKTVIPNIDDYKQMKQRGLGILSVVGILSAALTAWGSKLIKTIFGG